MKYYFVLLLALITNDPREIAKINALKEKAEEAFLAGNYEVAIANYSMLYDSLGVKEDEIRLNMAHAYYNLQDTSNAKSYYNNLSASTNKELKSVAYQQLGVMNKEAGKLEESLQQLKSSLKANPANQQARYNYEVVKKQLEEQQQQQQDQQQQDQENEDQENQENQENQDQQNQENQENQENEEQQNQEEQQSEENKEGEEKENQEQKEGEQEEQEEQKSQEELTKEKLKEMNISEEKARMILEAMKNNEIQYLQQQKRKATEKPPSDKPDW